MTLREEMLIMNASKVFLDTNEKIFQTPLQSNDVVLKINEFQKNFMKGAMTC
ncbi:hypothetical protein U27_00720 [Candidatus Vecturithrix granuli]|uniref:Uncharacterized protein n=1 Tax=Vecturithrix granuli TaxID=1499967 RepID=A0A081C8B7_VECG1|nr:hypothetical protein U27_00720 [Candidatus Vecturithrix granuli]